MRTRFLRPFDSVTHPRALHGRCPHEEPWVIRNGFEHSSAKRQVAEVDGVEDWRGIVDVIRSNRSGSSSSLTASLRQM